MKEMVMTLANVWRGKSLALAGWLVLIGRWPWGAAKKTSKRAVRKDVTYLASDECEGRGVETEGIQKAAAYIAAEFAEAGLKPGGVGGTYFQPFDIQGRSKLEGISTLSLKGPLGQVIDLKLGTDFQVMGLSGSGTVTAPIVFVGYGATAPNVHYDDYKGIDVAGKIVRRSSGTRPRWKNHRSAVSTAPTRTSTPAWRKSKGWRKATKPPPCCLSMIPRSAGGDKLMPFRYGADATPGGIPAVQVRRPVADMIFESSLDTSLADVEKAIDRDLKPRSRLLAGWTATVTTNVQRTTIACKNIIGVAEGAGPLANETVVIGAHYDHLGYGGRGSLAKDPSKKQIHHGADDNGSGTTIDHGVGPALWRT